MPLCEKCGAELDEDARFCPSCGTPVAPQVAERRRAKREQRRPISTTTIALIVLLVAVAVVTVVATVLFSGFWRPFGRVIGSGELVTKEMDFSDFTIVEAGSGFEVEITQSSSYSVSITADDNVFDYIQASKTGDTLTMHLKWGYSYQSLTLRAKITMPELSKLEFSGGTRGTVDMSVGDVEIDLSGGSRLTGGLTASGDAQFTLSGGSHIDLDGAANDLLIDASGGSHLELSDFPVHNVNVELSGGSQATINLDGRLDADLSGGSKLFYIGEPTMGDINTSGDSTIEKK